MSKVIMQASMSLDGFIAHPDDSVGPLFDWYSGGEVAVTYGDSERVFHTSAASAAYIRRVASEVGAGVIGRRLFDLTNGWNGRPATGDAVVVVTHTPPTDWEFAESAPFHFVDGVGAAIALARELAGDRAVSVTPGDIGGQAVAAGLVDEVRVDLVPVVLGRGVRYFGDFTGGPQLLDDPEIIAGQRVTHLIFPVRRTAPTTES